jgi:hypothetical protein
MNETVGMGFTDYLQQVSSSWGPTLLEFCPSFRLQNHDR